MKKKSSINLNCDLPEDDPFAVEKVMEMTKEEIRLEKQIKDEID